MNKISVMIMTASVVTGAFAGWRDLGKAAAGAGAKTAIKTIAAAEEQKPTSRGNEDEGRQQLADKDSQGVVADQEKKVSARNNGRGNRLKDYAEKKAAEKAAAEKVAKEREEKNMSESTLRSSEDIKKSLKDSTTKFTAGWMMWDAYKNLSEEDRKEFVDMAEKRALKAKESTIVFEGFYVNMPLIDFIALSEEKKIFQKWEKMFSGSSRWHYAEVPDARDLASRYVVTQMIFEGKDWYKLLKCEDDEAFDQFIHQYVLKKTGKASPLTALSKSKLKGPDSYDRWWLTYTSSRYGIAAGWCKDKSFLKLEKVAAE